uniref:Gamma-tubulin complex component n=1 Tax=Onchocerca volvulus TaxID=6282 RepID=A0A2K6VIB3_ONCVO
MKCEQDLDNENANGTATTAFIHQGATSTVMDRRRKWRIEVSNEYTRLNIPEGVQAYRVSIEDNILMNNIRNVLKNLEKRPTTHKVKITEQELINHLLRILDVNRNCSFLIPKPCGSYELDGSYCLSDGIVDQTEIGIYVEPFLEARAQIIALVTFSQKDQVHSQVEQVLQEFVLDFLSRHTRAVGELYNNNMLNLRTLLHSVRDELLKLSAVYNSLSVMITANIWNYRAVDCFLDRFLTTTLYTELRPHSVKQIIGRLQHAVLAVFERYFDRLFSIGEIDPVLENEFIFQSMKDSKVIQTRRTRCLFWSKLLIKYVENGALNAHRLRTGSFDYEAPDKFSVYLRKALRLKDDGCFITAQKIMRSMEYACEKCAKNNSSLLFRSILENSALSQVLKEMESIYTGFALREMAFDLFGATRTSQHCNIVLSFQKSLQLSGFPPEICERWTIWCGNDLLDNLVIKPQLSWPLHYLIEEKLLSTLNLCLRFLLRLLQAQEALSAVRIDLAAMKELNISRQRLNHLICFIAQPLTAISEIFFTHLQAMITKKFALVSGSKTLEEAQHILKDLNMHLANLITRSGSRGLIHDAITKLCDRATEVELRLRMDTISLRDVEKMLKVVKREKDLLVGLGRSMHGTIFTLLQPLLT